jgi:hypothetical protein
MASSKKVRTADVENKSLSCSMKIITISIAAVALLMMISGCTPHQIYRTEYQAVCPSVKPEECEKYALQRVPTGNGASYLLGFIEFDDQGQLWSREQKYNVIKELDKEAASGALIVVFIHGWKHSAAPGDTNITVFRSILTQLSEIEVHKVRQKKGPARQVAGLYLGWRGGSVPWEPAKELTFWDRKNTAHKVGNGGVAEVLTQLEYMKTNRKSSLVVIAHSMGSIVLYSALAQILEDRFNKAPESEIHGFGNLVVLINSAFEANLFTSLSDMATEKGGYHKSQRPLLAFLDSEGDWATGLSFPAGRWLSTRFEKEDHNHQRKNAVTGQVETISAYEANISAIGHFTPYRTHQLGLREEKREQKREDIKPLRAEESFNTFTDAYCSWVNDHPGSVITFGDMELKRNNKSAGRNPYLVIEVDEKLIKDHNDLDDHRTIEFIKQLIQLSSDPDRETARCTRQTP